MNGQHVQLDGIPNAHELPAAVSVDVLDVAGAEVEVYSGSHSALRAFLKETRATLDSTVTLPDGTEVHKGNLGTGDSSGYAFWFSAGDFRVYGHAPPGVSLETLVRHWSTVHVTSDSDGVCIAARRSQYRQPNIMQMVPGCYLIDVRLARTRRKMPAGKETAGGFLYRSDPRMRSRYLVLDADCLLAYVIPVPGQHINAALEGASQLTLDLCDALPSQTAHRYHAMSLATAAYSAQNTMPAVSAVSAASVALAFETLPVISADVLRRRSAPSPLNRRSFIRRTTATVGALGIAYMSLWNPRRGQAGNDGVYFREWTDPSSGPCERYAAKHNDEQRKCGPSFADVSYCWAGETTVSEGAGADIGNKEGWHKWGPAPDGGFYSQRPDQCLDIGGNDSDYDSWWWTFSDGVTYGCSDGRVCNSQACFLNTSCPWPRV